LVKVDNQDTVVCSLAPDDAVEPCGPLPPVSAEWVDRRRIRHGEGENRGALAARLTEDDHVLGANRVEVARPSDDVVDTAEHGEQIRLHG
jgi:hypothetical protein